MGSFQGYVACQPPLNNQLQVSPSFVYPQGVFGFYNGYTHVIMYARDIRLNSGNVSSGDTRITLCQGVASLLANYNIVIDQALYIDSGATNHVSQNASIFLSCSNYIIVQKLYIKNDMGLSIQHVGSTVLNTHTTQSIYLTNVLHRPNITKNLISVSRSLIDINAEIEFHKSACCVKFKSKDITLLKGITRCTLSS